MELGETGKSRVRGYLYVLERSLRSFLPREVVADAVREIETHIADRVSTAEAQPDERTALERVLAELGPPLRVAQAYSAELTIDEAVTTGRIGPMARAIWYFAVTSVAGFFGAVGLLIGYTLGASFVAVGVLKPIFPNNVGLLYDHGQLRGLGAHFPVEPWQVVAGGYWIIPVALAAGLVVLVATHRVARRWLGWFRERRDQRLGAQTLAR
jgi:hypothetical protein